MSKFSFNTANLSGSFAEKLAALEAAGFASATLWPADLFVHFENPEATIALIRSSAVSVSAYQCVRDLEGSPPEVKVRKLELARQFMDQASTRRCRSPVGWATRGAVAQPEMPATAANRLSSPAMSGPAG